MKRALFVLGTLLVVQLLASLGLGRQGDLLASRSPQKPLLAEGVAAVDGLVVTDDEEHRVALRKVDGKWQLPGYFDAPADGGKVKGLMDAVAKVKLGYPVGTSEEAAARFKVAEETFSRHVKLMAGDRVVAEFYLGRSAGVDRSYLRPAGEEAVYLAGLPEWHFPARPERWLDPALLKPEAGGLSSLAVDGLKLVKQDEEGWRAEGLAPGETLKKAGVEKLVSTLAGLRVDAILGTDPDPSWKPDRPVRRLVLAGEAGEVTWLLLEPEKGDFHVLKSSRHPWYFRLESWNARPLLDASTREALVEKAETTLPGDP